jgi:alpha-glucosidase (family GH31 glycosyl hydrolase)
LPYTYTLAWQAHTLGLPLMRPLALNYPDDPEVLDRSSEFLWGDDLLVAPVTRAGARHWPVYLPKGAWCDFWTGEAHGGGQAITAAAPLDRLPLFIRAGAIVPLGPVTQNLKDYAPEEITILVNPAAASSFTLYEDDGETNAYRNGHFALTEFTAVQSANELVIGIAAAVGDQTVLPSTRAYTLQVYAPVPPKSVEAGDGPPRWRHDGGFLFVTIAKHPTEVRITW